MNNLPFEIRRPLQVYHARPHLRDETDPNLMGRSGWQAVDRPLGFWDMPITNPYEDLPPTAFWRSAVGQREPQEIASLWAAKFPIARHDPIITAGSCFAQHLGRALQRAGYAWHDAEPVPLYLSEGVARNYGYGIFSFRTGNIYTVALLRQWIGWALGTARPSSEIWADDERFYDPFRPNVEPRGFASEEELLAAREWTLKAIRDSLASASLFVFTLGLTEAWRSRIDGMVYPVCPGTLAGAFDPDKHKFCNFRYDQIRHDLESAMELIHSVNPKLRFLLTVSPVPLTATASSQHVLVATTQSKSTLRAVAGDVAAERRDTDYFPSYEIISSFPFKAVFYEPNLRTVTREGVEFVMRSFFAGLPNADVAENATEPARVAEPPSPSGPSAAGDTIVCEELLLEAFTKFSG